MQVASRLAAQHGGRMRIALLVLLVGCSGLGRHVVTDWKVEPSPNRTWDEVLAHPTKLQIEKMLTGWVEAGPAILIDPSNPRTPEALKKELWVPVPSYLVRHPTHGLFVFDTGVAAGDCSYGSRPFFWVPCQASPQGDVVTQLEAKGVSVKDLRAIVLSHAHGDHAGALKRIENQATVPVVLSESEWAAANSGTRLFSGYLTEQLEGSYAVELIHFGAQTMPILGRVVDLFGDGSVWLIDSKGHTDGQLSVLFNAEEGPVLMTFDASHLAASVELKISPGFVTDKAEALTAVDRLAEFMRAYPQVQIIYGHEPTPMGAAGTLNPRNPPSGIPTSQRRIRCVM